jgi:hypothetical protein
MPPQKNSSGGPTDESYRDRTRIGLTSWIFPIPLGVRISVPVAVVSVEYRGDPGSAAAIAVPVVQGKPQTVTDTAVGGNPVPLIQVIDMAEPPSEPPIGDNGNVDLPVQKNEAGVQTARQWKLPSSLMVPPKVLPPPENETPNWLAGRLESGANTAEPGPPPLAKLPASFVAVKSVPRKRIVLEDVIEYSRRDVERFRAPPGSITEAGALPDKIAGSPGGRFIITGALKEAP